LASGLGWIGVETVIPLYAASTTPERLPSGGLDPDEAVDGDDPQGTAGGNGTADAAAAADLSDDPSEETPWLERRVIIGALALGEKVTETRLTFEESSLLSLVANQVGISLQNSAMHEERVQVRLLEEEVSTARLIQEQLLPGAPPALPGWELCASNSPSRWVGGDYHDFLPLAEGEMGIAIGDVSGKGVPAALLMSNLQATLRGRVLRGSPTQEVVGDVNRHICRSTGPESFISFFLGELHPECGTFRFTNAGHNAPIVVRRDGTVELLEDGGLLLGVFPEATYETGAVGLEPGDLVVLYTDGVTEAHNPLGDMYSEERLMEAVVRHRNGSADTVHARILEEVAMFQDGRDPDDDLTLILLKRTVPAETNGAGDPGVTALESNGGLQ
ncbi:MAG: PP2C family protein-serine/threonine phosphatase, partial [Gemmatimonadetes bacterium]|nr:PP2C family protein-serine/threonine phosphatase [Gemmatimonadota bacterium]